MLELGGGGDVLQECSEDLDFGPVLSDTDLLDISEFHIELN